MADKPETRLARWSRLKRSGLEPEAKTAPDDQLPVSAPVSSEKAEVELAETRDDTPASLDLPDIDSLNAESDFSVFLREGVSDEIRRKALRVLWRSDPVLANLDGLNDYDEDFGVAGALAEAVRTAYEVGKGYLGKERPEMPRAASDESASLDSTTESPVAKEHADDGEGPEAAASRESEKGAEISHDEPNAVDGSVTKV